MSAAAIDASGTARSGYSMSEIMAPLKRYFQTGELNFRIADPDGRIEALEKEFSDGRQDRTDGLLVEYEDWWFNVRKSNTEPILRLNLEADSADRRETCRARVEAVIVSDQ